MSLVFSSTSDSAGICELIDDEVGSNTTTYPLAKKARDINLAIDSIMLLLFGNGAGGSWQLDDANHTAYPIITTNLVSGQRDYFFTTDQQGNYILDIYKVMAKDSQGVFKELTPVDQQGTDANLTMNDGQNTTGTPTQYDKTGNGIFLDLIPSYNSTNGLKIFINREASYFTSADTTKRWGFTGIWHEYLFLSPCYKYARAKGLASAERLKRDLLELEAKIAKHSVMRQRDVNNRFIPLAQDNH